MLAHGRSTRRSTHANMNKIGICVFICFIIIACGVLYIIQVKGKQNKDYHVDEAERQFFYIFNRTFSNPEGYHFRSLETYCLEDDISPERVYIFIRAQFDGYIEIDNEWADMDLVYYGENGHLDSFFGLNWEDIEAFERHVEQYQKAVKEGVKKTYTLAEIQEMIDKYKPED